MICYHGTRNYNGGDLLPYCPTEMKAYIDRLLQKIGLSFKDWSERGYMASRIIADLEDAKRRRIWLTDNMETAKSYATRSPEIAWDALMDAIDNVLWGRRWRHSNMLKLCKARNEWIANILEGKQTVLTVSVAEGGFNYPIDFIPRANILGVLTLSYQELRRKNDGRRGQTLHR